MGDVIHIDGNGELPDEAPTEFEPTDGKVHFLDGSRIDIGTRKDTGETHIIASFWCREHDNVHAYWMHPEDAVALGSDLIIQGRRGAREHIAGQN